MADGTVIYKIEGDNSGFAKDVGESEKIAKSGWDNIKSHGTAAFHAIGVAIAAVATAMVAAGKQGLTAFAEYEQVSEGAKLLWGDAYDFIAQKASTAYKDVGMSTNDYLTTVNGYSVALKESMGNNSQAAAELASRIVTAQADVVAATGASQDAVLNAFNGIMKGNYTMMDNLQLGIKPTKEGFQEVIDKVNEWNATNGKATEYSMDSLADQQAALVDYISMVGLAGYAAAEASDTISGSYAQAKAAWDNLMTGMGDGDANFDELINNFVDSVLTLKDNIVPVLQTMLPNMVSGLSALLNAFLPEAINLLLMMVPALIDAITGVFTALGVALIEAYPQLITVLGEGLTQIMAWLGEALPMLVETLVAALPQIVTAIIEFIPQMIVAGIQLFTALIEALPEIISGIVAALPQIIDGIVTGLTTGIPMIIDAGIQLFLALVQNLPAIITGIVAALPQIIDGIVNGVVALIPVLIDAGVQLFLALVQNIPAIISGIVAALPEIINGVISGLTTAWSALVNAVITLVGSLGEALGELFNGIWETIKEIFSGVAEFFGGIFAAAAGAISAAWAGITSFFSGIWSGVQSVFASVGSWFGSTFSAAASAISSAWSGVKSFFSGVWNGIKGVFATVGSWFRTKFTEAKNGMQTAFSAVKSFFSSKWSEIKGVFSNAKSAFTSIGSNVVAGIRSGISNAWSGLLSWAKGLFSQLKTAAQNALNIHSPSKDFEEIGKNVLLGLMAGMEEKEVDTLAQLTSLFDRMKNDSEEFTETNFEEIGKSILTSIESGMEGGKDELLSMAEAAIMETLGVIKNAEGEFEGEQADTAKKIMETFGKGLDEGYDAVFKDLKDDLDALTKEYQAKYNEVIKMRDNLEKKLLASGDTFRFVADNSKEKMFAVTGDLDYQISVMQEYSDAIDQLVARDIPDGLLQELLEMDIVEGKAAAKRLLALTDESYVAFITKWQEKQDLAKEIAQKTYQDKLDDLDREFKQKAEDLFATVEQDFSQIGKDTMEGWMKGMESKLPSLRRVVQKIANEVIATARETLSIASPSKVFARIGEFVDLGLAAGIDDESESPVTAMQNMLSGVVGKAIASAPSLNSIASTLAPTSPNGSAIYVYSTLTGTIEADGFQLANIVLRNLDDAAAFTLRG